MRENPRTILRCNHGSLISLGCNAPCWFDVWALWLSKHWDKQLQLPRLVYEEVPVRLLQHDANERLFTYCQPGCRFWPELGARDKVGLRSTHSPCLTCAHFPTVLTFIHQVVVSSRTGFPVDSMGTVTMTIPVNWICQTEPSDVGNLTTPPLPSSSPGPGCDSMDISPLPHKAPFTSSFEIQLQSPTPELTSADSSILSLPSPPLDALPEPTKLTFPLEYVGEHLLPESLADQGTDEENPHSSDQASLEQKASPPAVYHRNLPRRVVCLLSDSAMASRSCLRPLQ